MWEKRLTEAVAEVNATFFKSLVKKRRAYTTFLKSDRGDPFKLGQLQSETGKALRNTENYLKNLVADSKKNIGEKERLWEKVVGRVEDKFYSRVNQVEDEVRSWWQNVTNHEVALVQDAYSKIKELAGSAQMDLGMDYAWLDDVSYQDWQRYHALMDVAEENGKLFQSIQDGSHPNSPINEPLRLMMDLQNELQDIADGFETRFTQVARRGYQTLAGEIEAAPKPEFSVLPTQPQEHANNDGELADALLSRSAEEVVAALGHVHQKDEMEISLPEQRNTGFFTASSHQGPASSTSDDSATSDPMFSILPKASQGNKPIEILDGSLSREKDQIDSAIASRSIVEKSLSSEHSAALKAETEAIQNNPVPGDDAAPTNASLGNYKVETEDIANKEET